MRDLVSIAPIYGDYLVHHGIKGQKWGIRRYQNEDGSLTEEGKKRYSEIVGYAKDIGKVHAELERQTRELTDGVPKGTQILVPPEVRQNYKYLFEDFLSKTKIANKTIGEVTSDVVTMDDGYDYIRTLIHDKKLNGAIEYMTLI